MSSEGVNSGDNTGDAIAQIIGAEDDDDEDEVVVEEEEVADAANIEEEVFQSTTETLENKEESIN
jgi:ribosome-binding ATPase YchF (GTP1/OBG family)